MSIRMIHCCKGAKSCTGIGFGWARIEQAGLRRLPRRAYIFHVSMEGALCGFC